MCVVCRERESKRALIRIVRGADGTVSVDETGRKNGRGAYLCTKRVCWERAANGNVLEHALKTTLPLETRAELRAYAAERLVDEDAANNGKDDE
jgi:predicted RNA-binding protein YlxR (DUF448 family)